jgi:lipopolysaccharide transport system ATP-binding protein
MTIVVEARGVGKQYVRGAGQHRRLHTLRDALSEWAGRVVRRKPSDRSTVRAERFWALKDVSFTIEQGEVVGIIGRNGSGKSTLLKIVSQITAPTAGEVRLHGRTGTLLEVGTGFHQELTGRENVFLNGTILGMRRSEIAQKFDEIVAFSGVENFIDTPVKRYSSGMQMRLAFAVAAHLDPEILVVDEVLAVGDAEFQKKCLGKMEDLSRTGRTILFVSHNMSAIDRLCSRVIWIDGGMLIEDSRDAYAATTRYLFGDGGKSTLKAEWRPPSDHAFETEYFSLRWFRVRDPEGRTITRPIRNDEQAFIEIALNIKKMHAGLEFGCAVINEAGVYVFMTLASDQADANWPKMTVGDVVLSAAVPPRLLNEGLYRLDLMAGLYGERWFSVHFSTPYAVFLRIQGGMSDSSHWRNSRPGIVAPILGWSGTAHPATAGVERAGPLR